MIPLFKTSGLVILLLVLFAMFPQNSRAATDKTDSLKLLIAANPGQKEAVSNLLALTAIYTDRFELDTAIFYGKQALSLATSLNDRPGIAESNYKLHLAELKRSNNVEAVNYIIRFNAVSEALHDESLLGKGYYSYGTLLIKQGENDSAIYYIQKSLEINRRLKDTLRLMAAYNTIGNLFSNISEYDSAAYYYLWAAKLAETSGSLRYLGVMYNNLGSTFLKVEDFEKADYYLQQALEINKLNKDYKVTAQCYSKLGDNYLNQFIIDKALWYYDQAMEIYLSLKDQIGMADIYNNLGVAYKLQEQNDAALENYKKALEIYRSQLYTEGITISMKNIGEIYNTLGKYDLARVYLDSSLNISTTSGYLQNQRMVLDELARNYYLSGDYKKAYDYYDLYFNLYDSLLGVEKTKALNDLEKKYQKEKDQARILTLEKENLSKTIQRNAFMATGTGVVMLAVFLILYLRQRARKDRIIAQQQILQLEEEKKVLTAMSLVEGQEEERKRIALELHDGLGVLLSATKMQFSAIKNLSPENQVLFERASQMLDQASGDVRRVSHNMMPGLLTRLGFFEAVGDLIDNINDMKSIEATCTITGDQENRLPEMVNNTLKHAGARHITLNMNRTEDKLELHYADDGNGFDVDHVLESNGTSIGLKSIRSRTDFMGGNVKITSSPGNGTRYDIEIPL
jgi:signal transduction histidine kinase